MQRLQANYEEKKYLKRTLGGGGSSCTPSKDFKKLGHKNSIKRKNERPPRFFYNPMYPLKRI
jgi:hypothetical protein